MWISRDLPAQDKLAITVSNESAMIGIGIVVLAIMIGTIAFAYIEKWDFFHSLYYVAITISTIGYGDMTPVTHLGKALTTGYALVGVPLFIYAAWLVIEARIRSFVITHLHEQKVEIDKIKQSKKEAEETMEEFSDNLEDATEEMEDAIKILDKARAMLRKKHKHMKK